MQRPTSVRSLELLLACIAATLCASCVTNELDLDISAALRVDLSQDEELADLDITLDFQAGREAYAEVNLARAAIYEHEAVVNSEPPLLDLDLAFPEDFDPVFEPHEQRSVTLHNLGTRNGDFSALEQLCGISVALLVAIEFDAVDGHEPGIDSMTLVIATPLECQG